MNKIFTAIIGLSLNLTAANFHDKLDIAIRTSNAKAVETILVEHKLSTQEALRYYVIAKEVNEVYKNPRLNSAALPAEILEVEYKSILYVLAMMPSGLVTFFSGAFFIEELWMHGRFNFRHLGVAAIALLIVAKCGKKVNELNNEAVKLFNRMRQNAITIKSLFASKLDLTQAKSVESL